LAAAGCVKFPTQALHPASASLLHSTPAAAIILQVAFLVVVQNFDPPASGILFF
jgi:hypothetical protein